ncbi:hypothetical protein T261_7904 [Streptomyces lydicus]|nr:hypothetical protein T261_7904 [Streptomyces lydicus]
MGMGLAKKVPEKTSTQICFRASASSWSHMSRGTPARFW